MQFPRGPHRRASCWPSIGREAVIEAGGLLGERDPPQARDRVALPFEDWRLGGEDLCRLGVVYPDLLAIKDGEVPGVARFTCAEQAVKCDVGHPVKGACWIAEVVVHACFLGGMGMLPCCHREHFGQRLPGQFQTAVVFADAGCCAGINDGGRDGPVHDALLRRFLACLSLGSDDVVVPPVQAWTLPEIAVPLVMSGRADLCEFRADVNNAKVADVHPGFLVGK